MTVYGLRMGRAQMEAIVSPYASEMWTREVTGRTGWGRYGSAGPAGVRSPAGSFILHSRHIPPRGATPPPLTPPLTITGLGRYTSMPYSVFAPPDRTPT